MGHAIEKVSWRKQAKARRAPYWKLHTAGRYVGWRKMAAAGPGKWLAKAWDGSAYPQRALGDFAARPEEERYTAALEEAMKWFRHLDGGGTTTGQPSVRAICEDYVESLRMRSPEASAAAQARLARLVYDDPVAGIEVAKLRARDVAGWKARLLARGWARSSFNREIVYLRAALNLAHRRREVASDHAWKEELRPLEDADARRTLYLAADERRALLEKATTEARPFLAVLNMLPMRPGEVALLKVKHFKPAHRVLEIPSGKAEARIIPLTDAMVEHFAGLASRKLPEAWLVSCADGRQWRRHIWAPEVREAARKAKLPRAVVAYTLRHSVITDLVTGGLDLFTVAKLAGTSVVMIERHYGHLQREHARAALERLALA
jgi:site-specific recombinase XerD